VCQSITFRGSRKGPPAKILNIFWLPSNSIGLARRFASLLYSKAWLLASVERLYYTVVHRYISGAFQWLFAKQNCLITKPLQGVLRGGPWTPSNVQRTHQMQWKNPSADGNPIGAASFSPANNSRQIQFWTHHNTQTQSQMGEGYCGGGVGFFGWFRSESGSGGQRKMECRSSTWRLSVSLSLCHSPTT